MCAELAWPTRPVLRVSAGASCITSPLVIRFNTHTRPHHDFVVLDPYRCPTDAFEAGAGSATGAEAPEAALVAQLITPAQPCHVLQFDSSVLGGTFDHLHCAHKVLLTMAAFLAQRRVVCGVTGLPALAHIIAK